MQNIINSLAGVAMVAFFMCWTFGGFVGAVYWAVQEEILDVVLSIFIPMYGAVTVLFDLIK